VTPGVFISLDGLDGTGKTTQGQRLVAALRAVGHEVCACADPGGTPLGAKLRELLLDARQTGSSTRAEALLFMASRAELVQQIIRPALERGDIVVSDRFVLANVVYQGHAGGLRPADVWSAADFSTGGLRPTRTIVLDLPTEAAAHRRGRTADRMEAKGLAFLERVRAGFLAEAAADPSTIAVIDATPAADAVHAAILDDVMMHLRQRGYPTELRPELP
jgi:dTMP kinase